MKERVSDPEEESEAETVSIKFILRIVVSPGLMCAIIDAYNRAISMKLVQTEVEQIVPLILARAGYEKRCIAAGKAGTFFPTG
jgi:squamous cell carcinoma antigen recognized by T-cells 3